MEVVGKYLSAADRQIQLDFQEVDNNWGLKGKIEATVWCPTDSHQQLYSGVY